MSKYLRFTIIEEKPKKTIGVYAKKRENLLGTIEWFNRWKQYAFFPEKNTVFDSQCLDDIQTYLKEL